MNKTIPGLFWFFSLSSSAQVPVDWGAFVQQVDAAPYTGKKFRIEAAVKVQTISPDAEGEIWVRVDRNNKKMWFFYNMMDKPIRLNEWKVYSISGKIDKDAASLNFGGLYHRKGIFYFDNFKLFIEKDKDQFEEIPLKEGDFEGDSALIRKSWGYLQKRNGLDIGITSTDAASGKQCFMVDGSHFKPPGTYGNNDSVGHYANVNGIKMYYEIYGEGEPLLLLHGNSASISSFDKQIPELSKYYKVIAVDSRGQGKSTEDGKKFSYELFAGDTKSLLDYLGLDSVNILGWSDGGNIGLIMAMQYPGKVKRLAIMGANLYNNLYSVKSWVNKLLMKENAEITDSSYSSIFRKRMIDLLLHEPNINEKDLSKIDCPVLVMAGSNDVIKEKHTKLIAENIRHSTLMIFEKGDHYEPSTRPERFNITVLEFLRQK